MRKSKYDKFVFIACLVVFIYSFFFTAWETVYKDENILPPFNEIDHIIYPASVLIAPLACILFFFLMVFDDELLVVDRYWVKDSIAHIINQLKKKVKDSH